MADLNGKVKNAESVIRSAAMTNRLPVNGVKQQIAYLA